MLWADRPSVLMLKKEQNLQFKDIFAFVVTLHNTEILHLVSTSFFAIKANVKKVY